MHAVLITFESSIPTADLAGPFEQYAQALQSVAGLQTKTWIQDDTAVGGFHLFDDRTAAEAYLGSDLAASLMATEGFDHFQVRHFEVLDELSALTGITPADAGLIGS